MAPAEPTLEALDDQGGTWIAFHNGDPKTGIRITGFTADGRLTEARLPDEALVRLVRAGIRRLDAVGYPDRATVPPFVVTLPLPYSNLSPDQDTPQYTWAVRTTDRNLAARIVDAAHREVERVSAFRYGVVPQLPPLPEFTLQVSALSRCRDVVDALASLRVALLGHQSDSILDDDNDAYWRAAGFHEDDVDEVVAYLDDDASARSWLDDLDTPSVEHLKLIAEDNPGDAANPWFPALLEWASGAAPEAVAAARRAT